MLVFLIGLRFVTPTSVDATVVQRTIQLVPRLPEPTLVTEVLQRKVRRSKRTSRYFSSYRRPYEYKVSHISGPIRRAKQNVKVLKLDADVAAQDATRTKVDLAYQQYQKKIFDQLAKEKAVREEAVDNGLPELTRRRPRKTVR